MGGKGFTVGCPLGSRELTESVCSWRNIGCAPPPPLPYLELFDAVQGGDRGPRPRLVRDVINNHGEAHQPLPQVVQVPRELPVCRVGPQVESI